MGEPNAEIERAKYTRSDFQPDPEKDLVHSRNDMGHYRMAMIARQDQMIGLLSELIGAVNRLAKANAVLAKQLHDKAEQEKKVPSLLG